jgi:hypothetical protein
MPVNLIDIQRKLSDFSAQARARKEKIAVRQQEVTDLVDAYAGRLDELRERAGRAAELIPRLRCALPTEEALNLAVPCPVLPGTFTVLAADGSQINPNRHARVAFCVINVGVVKMVRGSGQAPKIFTHSQLLDFDAVFLPNGGMISEGMVALKRDLREREALLELADDLVSPAVSMTDGPLELYREPQEVSGFNQTLDRYLEVLSALHQRDLMTLGYVDKPGSDLIGRLLELLQMDEDDLASYNQRRRRFAGVNDVHLLSAILQNPGDRSAVFGIHSEIARRFGYDLALHFFYLNVGLPGRPHLARVEIPAWVARDKALLGTLQGVLVEQAAMMGTRPYPYILHRAHEEAIVSLQESEHVEEMIVAAFNQRGIPIDEKSYKQYHKDLPTQKTRYQG